MSRFDRYVLSQLLVVFGFFSLVLVAVYWINQAVLVFDRLIADGQSAGAVLAFTALTLPKVIGIVLPMSAFAASVYVTNRLNSESELVVVQATGFSPFRIAVPYLVFGLIVAIMTGALMNVLVPMAEREATRQRADLANNVTARFLSPGEFLQPSKGVTFYIGELTPEGVLQSVFLSDARNPDEQTTYIAREAFLVSDVNGPKLVMVDGIAQILSEPGQRLSITRFDDFSYDIGRLIAAVRPPQPSAGHLSTLALLGVNAQQAETLNSTTALLVWDAHRRIAQSLLAIFTTLIGFATLLLGAFSRFGVWRQIIAAIALLIVLKMLDNVTLSMPRDVQGSWMFNYIIIITSAVVCWSLLKFAARERKPRRHASGEVAT